MPALLRVSPAALVLLLLLAAGAAAGGDVVLRFRDGRLASGRVVEMQEETVLVATEKGKVSYRWEDLTPFSAYEVRASVLAEDDGEARLALGRWCLAHGLPAEARREVLRARGLGAGEAKALDTLLGECDREEAEAAFAEAERREAAGDLAAAVEVLRTYLMRAPASEWTTKAREQAADLVRRREAEEARRRLEAEEERKARLAGRKADYVRGKIAAADEARAEGARLALVGLREEIGGAFSRFRDALGQAETRFLEARAAYRAARRVAGEDDPASAWTGLAGERAMDGRLLDLYLRLARTFVAHKSWEEAQKALDKALRIDPVNPEGLELQATVNKNWLRRKLSEITNAAGTTNDR